MFAKGDYVFYASGGVCRVDDLQYAPLDGMPADRLYYVLRSLHDANGVICLKGGDLSAETAPFRRIVETYALNEWIGDSWFEGKYMIYLPI